MGEVEAAAAGEQELARRRGRGVVNDDATAACGERLRRRQTGRSGADHDRRRRGPLSPCFPASMRALQVRGPPPRRPRFSPSINRPSLSFQGFGGNRTRRREGCLALWRVLECARNDSPAATRPPVGDSALVEPVARRQRRPPDRRARRSRTRSTASPSNPTATTPRSKRCRKASASSTARRAWRSATAATPNSIGSTRSA